MNLFLLALVLRTTSSRWYQMVREAHHNEILWVRQQIRQLKEN